MKIVTIYLRSIELNGENHLAMFDSNRNGAIDNLITVVPVGYTVLWKLDCLSGLRSITKIYSKTKQHNVFKTDPKKRLLCKGFKLHISKDIFKLPISKDTKYEEEAYAIDYIRCDGKKLTTDPVIRVPPPPTHG